MRSPISTATTISSSAPTCAASIRTTRFAAAPSTGTQIFTYNETLDTTYTGGYIGIGGEYSFGFIPFVGSAVKGVGGIYDRLGLRTFINLRAGLYNATPIMTAGSLAPGAFNSRISQSHDELAFIGTVSLETRKQIGMRSSLSLWTDYEYISSVPEMRYNNGAGQPTRIDDDAVFASRTMLRLNIGLGPATLYPPPVVTRPFRAGRGRAQSFLSATVSTAWSVPLRRMRSARWRVGRMFSLRLTRLIERQIDSAVTRASSSDSDA